MAAVDLQKAPLLRAAVEGSRRLLGYNAELGQYSSEEEMVRVCGAVNSER